jgi:hypothetical protein
MERFAWITSRAERPLLISRWNNRFVRNRDLRFTVGNGS